MNISVIGGDLRQLTLAKLLEKDGYTVKIAGFDKGSGTKDTTPDDIWESDILIFPIPTSHDGVYINAPYSEKPIPVEAEKISGSKLILGGNISEKTRGDVKSTLPRVMFSCIRMTIEPLYSPMSWSYVTAAKSLTDVSWALRI